MEGNYQHRRASCEIIPSNLLVTEDSAQHFFNEVYYLAGFGHEVLKQSSYFVLAPSDLIDVLIAFCLQVRYFVLKHKTVK